MENRLEMLTAEIADFLHKSQIRYPEVSVGKECSASTCPAHLLREKGAWCGWADTCCKAKRNISDFPASIDGTEAVPRISIELVVQCIYRHLPSVDILREPDLRRTANLLKSSTTIQGITPDTNTRTPPIPVNLNNAVEQLLRRASPLLDPGLLVSDAEELWALHDRDLLIVELLDHQFLEEVRAGTEIRVEDGKEFAAGPGECPPQVARLLQPGAVIAHGVVEAVALCQLADCRIGTIIHDMHLDLVRGPVELRDVFPCVVQNLDLLGANWQVDVHYWRGLSVDGVPLNPLLMGFVVPVLADHSDQVADE